MVQIAGVGSFTAGDFDAELKTTLELNRQAQATARQVLNNTVQLFTTQRELQQRGRALGLAEKKEGRQETLFQQRQSALENLKRIEETADVGMIGPPDPSAPPADTRPPIERLKPSEQIALGSERTTEARIDLLKSRSAKDRAQMQFLLGLEEGGVPQVVTETLGNLLPDEVKALGGPEEASRLIRRAGVQMIRSDNLPDPASLTDLMRARAQSVFAIQNQQQAGLEERNVPEGASKRMERQAEKVVAEQDAGSSLGAFKLFVTSQLGEITRERNYVQLNKIIGDEIDSISRIESTDAISAGRSLRDKTAIGGLVKDALKREFEFDRGIVKAKPGKLRKTVLLPFSTQTTREAPELTPEEQDELLEAAKRLDINVEAVLKGIEE